jgi:hypothetical protein
VGRATVLEVATLPSRHRSSQPNCPHRFLRCDALVRVTSAGLTRETLAQRNFNSYFSRRTVEHKARKTVAQGCSSRRNLQLPHSLQTMRRVGHSPFYPWIASAQSFGNPKLRSPKNPRATSQPVRTSTSLCPFMPWKFTS